MVSSQSNRRIGSAISMISMVVSATIGLVYTPFVIRFLGDSEYGVYTLATGLISYLSLLDLGLGNALVRYTARVRAQGRDERNLIGMFLVFYSVIALIAVMIGVGILFHLESFFSASFDEAECVVLKRVFSILLVNTVVAFPASVFSSVVRSCERFIFANTLNLLQNIFSHLVRVILLFMGCRSVSLAVVSLAATIIMMIANVIFCFRFIGIKIGFKKLDRGFYWEIIVYSFFVFLNIVIDQLYANTDKIILGRFCGSIAVAVYGVGVTFQQYFTLLSTSISGVFLPHITRLSMGKNAKKQMSDTFLRVGHIQLVLLTTICLGFAIFGQLFIQLWVGVGYQDAYYIALLVMVPATVPLSQNIGISILQALNKHRVRSVMYLCIALLNVGISIPLSMKLGGIGTAIGTAIGNLFGQILFMNWYYWRRIGLDIPLYWKGYILHLIRLFPVAIVFSFSLLIPAEGWGGLMLKIGFGLLCVLPYYYFAIFTPTEKQMINSVVMKLSRIMKR